MKRNNYLPNNGISSLFADSLQGVQFVARLCLCVGATKCDVLDVSGRSGLNVRWGTTAFVRIARAWALRPGHCLSR